MAKFVDKEMQDAFEEHKRKENNKYYTPSIEELYVGFECEIIKQELSAKECYNSIESKLLKIEYKPNSCFAKHKITDVDIQMYFLNPHLLKNDIRVKYLDQEDIESLGWSKFNEIMAFKVGSLCYYLWHTKKLIQIGMGIVGNPIPETTTVFLGKIKNKSELKVLMKQLGIE